MRNTAPKTGLIVLVERGLIHLIRFAALDWEHAIYDDPIKAFEETNPNPHVQVVSINEILDLNSSGNMGWPDDADEQFVSAADVVKIDPSRQAVQKGLFRDLKPFIEADRVFQAEDFHPGALERYQWDGGTWALPITIDFQRY